MGFGTTLKEIRLRAGLERGELARLGGGNLEHLGKIESENRNPPRKTRLMGWTKVLIAAIQEKEGLSTRELSGIAEKLFHDAGYVLSLEDFRQFTNTRGDLVLYPSGEAPSLVGGQDLVYSSPEVKKVDSANASGKDKTTAIIGDANLLYAKLVDLLNDGGASVKTRGKIAGTVAAIALNWLEDNFEKGHSERV
jgi:transcriptional regulator with XRE-family HTH domain